MFFGQFDHNIDDKGRITIPSQYRDLLEGGAYITRGLDNCLMVLRMDEFDSLYHKIRNLSITNPKARDLSRLIFANAALQELDNAGRILIPQFLRDSAQLQKKIKVVGIGPFFEIWSPANWEGKKIQYDDDQLRSKQFEDLEITF